jgi:hypothetical protein
MTLDDLSVLVAASEPQLDDCPFVVVHVSERNGRPLHLALTSRLRTRARRRGIWRSRAFLASLKNAEYGFDPERQRNPSGRDGIFLLDRDFRPPNAMMRKLFDGYLDRPNSGVRRLADALRCSVEDLLPVRLVSHQMRLLGVLRRAPEADWLVLVDYDCTR